MKNIKYNPNKKGFVLSLVLWISAAMMLLSLLFVRLTKEQTQIYAQLHDKLKVELATQSLFEQISFYISSGKFQEIKVSNLLDNFPKSLYLDNREYNSTLNDITCFYSLLDHSGLYNIKYLLTIQEAQNTIQQISNTKYPFKDLYLDWIDKDQLTRINGAEKSDYLLDGYKYIPPNYISFQHKDSIILLKDFYKFDKNTSKNIRDYFTSYGATPINILLLDKQMLKSFFPKLTKDEIDHLLFLKDHEPETYRKSFTSHLSQDTFNSFASKTITVSIKCKHRNIVSREKVIVNYRTTNSRSWAILEVYK
jgi:general secretion pathway protein K